MKALFLKRLYYRVFRFECFGRAIIQKEVKRTRESLSTLRDMLSKPMPVKTRLAIEKAIARGEIQLSKITLEARLALIEPKRATPLSKNLEILKLTSAVQKQSLVDARNQLNEVLEKTKAAQKTAS